jgi:hypothetical protein
MDGFSSPWPLTDHLCALTPNGEAVHIIIASEATKQSRDRRAPYGPWIAASAFGLLAMTTLVR